MNNLGDGWTIAKKHLAGQHDQASHGRRGGGQMGLSDKPTMNEYISAKILGSAGIDPDTVYFSSGNLPPVPDGHTRIYHKTEPGLVKSIRERGLLPGKETGRGERLANVLGVAEGTGGKFGGGGLYAVVDLPSNSFRFINKSWVEFGAIRPSDITGFLADGLSGSPDQTIRAAIEWQNLYKEASF